ncbi:MAG TPA: T9SS type A sorting domain-containing protein [Bacteroidia bacterium]
MKKILLLSTIVFISLCVSAQTNNTCATALAHGNVNASSCTPVTFNVGGGNVPNATPALAAPCAATTTNVDEAWISFVAQSTVTIFEYVNSTRDAAVYIYSGSCAGLTQMACSDAAGSTNTLTLATTVGTTYWARIIREGGGNNATMFGTYCVYQGCTNATYTSLSNALYTNCAPVTPRNNITSGGPCFSGDNINKRVCLSGGCIEQGTYEEFISFTATAANMNIGYTDGTAGTVDIAVMQNTGTCAAPALTILDCFNGISATQTFLSTGLTVGTTYWIMVTATQTNVGTFNICLTTPPVACTDNDNCALETTAINLASNTQLCINDCNTGATNIGTSITASCTNPTGPVAWFEFTYPTTDVTLDITVTGTGFDPHIQIWSGCNTYYANGCDNGSANVATLTGYNIGGAGTFFVSVTPENGVATGNFEICVRTYPDNNSCNTQSAITANPAPVLGQYSPSTVVTFCIDIPYYDKAACNWLQGIVPTLTGNGWDLTFGTNGISPTVTPITQSHGFGNAVNASYGTWAWINSPTGVDYNQNPCGGAWAVPGNCVLPAGWYFTETGATNPDGSFGDGNTTPTANCWSDLTVDNDVWYSFTPVTTGNYCFSTNHTGGTLTDTQIAVWRTLNPVSSCQGSYVLVGCNDDVGATNYRSRVTVALTAGQTYFIQVDGWGGAIGTFGFSVSAVGGGCNNTAGIPAAAAVSNDLMCNAEVVTANTKIFGTNAAATASNNCEDSETPGFGWQACFQARTKSTVNCLYNEDLGISFKTYSDGEIGSWTSVGCVTDIQQQSGAAVAVCNNPLPIELLSFEAEYRKATRDVELSWLTATEINNDYFTIEKSQDGINFEFLTTVKGAGNSTQLLSYRSTDPNPYPGVSYYRLKQTDYDGKYEYSKVESVEISLISDLMVKPNPATDMIGLTFESENPGNMVINIYDATGKVVYSDKRLVLEGTNNTTIQLDGMNNGLYYIVITNGNSVLKSKFLKG